MPYVEVLQGARNMEGPPASQCPAADRRNNVQGPFRNGLRMDV